MPYFGDPPKAGKWAFSEQPRTYKERCHYRSNNGSDQDVMAKRRIAARAFGFQRQPVVYKSSYMVEPVRECIYYAPEEERLNKDVDGFIREIHDKRRARDKEILAYNKVAKAYEEYKVMCKREEAWDKEKLRDEFLRLKPHGRVFSNRSGGSYNILTMEYDDSYHGRRIRYMDEMAIWRQTLRRLFLQERSSSVQNFNILDWRRLPPVVEPVRPTPPVPDPAKELQGPKRVLKMQSFKPFAVEPGDIVQGDGKTPELLHWSPIPPQSPRNTVRDVIVNVKHPWEDCC